MSSTEDTSETSPAAEYKWRVIKHEGLKMTLRRERVDEVQTNKKRVKTRSPDRPRKIRRQNGDKEIVQSNENPSRLNIPNKANSHPLNVSGDVDNRISNETQKASLKAPGLTGPRPSNVPQKEVGSLECTPGVGRVVHNSEMNLTTAASEISPEEYEWRVIKHDGLKMTLRRVRIDKAQANKKIGKTECTRRRRKIRRQNEDKENTPRNEDTRRLNGPHKANSHSLDVSGNLDPRISNETQKAPLNLPRMSGSHSSNILRKKDGYPSKETQKTETQPLNETRKTIQRKDPRPFNVSLHTDPHISNVSPKTDILRSILPPEGDPLNIPWKTDVQPKKGNTSLSSGVRGSEEFKKEVNEKHKERTNFDERKRILMLKKSTLADERCSELKKQEELAKTLQKKRESKPNFPWWDPLGLLFPTASLNKELSPHVYRPPSRLQLSPKREEQRKQEQLERRRILEASYRSQADIIKDFEAEYGYLTKPISDIQHLLNLSEEKSPSGQCSSPDFELHFD